MAVSEDKDIDYCLSTSDYLRSTFTIKLLEDIAANNSKQVMVFLDNASFHR